MHGYEPFSAGATPPAESAKKVDPSSAGTVLPVESPKKLDPGSAVPPVESVKKVDPSSVDAVPPVASTEKDVDKKIFAAAPGQPLPQPLPSRANGTNPAASEHSFVPGEVLVELRPDVSPQAANDLASRQRLQLLAPQHLVLTGTTMYRYRIEGRAEGKRSVGAIVAALEADPRIAAVQPNYVYTLQNDRPGVLAGAQYAIPKMRLTEAHAISNGAKTLVAVIDSGIDRNHPELLNAVKDGFDPGGAKAVPALHGTAVAGIIAAHAELTGVAPQARILAVQAFGSADPKVAGHGTTYDILPGIEWSELHGARVVNMSFTGPRDPALAREIADGARRGVIFVAAVGNEGRSAGPLYPAADENVIPVTATDRSDSVFEDANRCFATCVAAPGVDVLVAEPSDAYGFLSGTSMAAAHVSGVVALLLDAKPDLELKAIRGILFKTARHLNPGDPDQASIAGIVDAFESLKAASAMGATDAHSAREVQAVPPTLKAEAQRMNAD
ncbi:MAG TPA: S8 family serine peptidase [Methylocella sp.]